MARDEDFIGPEGIKVVSFVIGEKYRCCIFVFPKPERLNEAFMSAIVVPSDIKIGDEGTSRYFILEYNPERPNKTFVGQWAGAHLNLGGGPVPTVPAFTKFLEDLVDVQDERRSDNSGFEGLFDGTYWTERDKRIEREAEIAKVLMSETQKKTEIQQVKESVFSVDSETRLLEARNTEALLQVQKAIIVIQPDSTTNFTGFYLNKTQTARFRKSFERACDKARESGEIDAVNSLMYALGCIHDATHPEHEDLGFCINIAEMPEISETAADETYFNCEEMRSS